MLELYQLIHKEAIHHPESFASKLKPQDRVHQIRLQRKARILN